MRVCWLTRKGVIVKVFLSWAGKESQQIAVLLREWLPSVIQSIQPWLSSEDIDKGARWNAALSRELDATAYGIVCVTRTNQTAAWLLFEAGALSKRLDASRVSPILIGISPQDLVGPLAQFQAVAPVREDVLRLLTSLNTASNDAGIPNSVLEHAFDREWGVFERRIQEIETVAVSSSAPAKPPRQQHELLEEVLTRVRSLERQLAEGAVPREPSGKHEVGVAARIPDRQHAGPSPLMTIARKYFGDATHRVSVDDDTLTIEVKETSSHYAISNDLLNDVSSDMSELGLGELSVAICLLQERDSG
jgi:hypothetical protein